MNLQKVKEFFKKDTLAQLLGIEILQASPEKSVCTMVVSENFLNAKGGVHGGTSNLSGKVTVTLDANVSYFKPAKDNILVATAELVSVTRHTCNYSVSVCDGENRLLAKVNLNGYRTDTDINFD